LGAKAAKRSALRLWIRRKLGSKWAYRLREAITLAVEAEWQRVIQSLRYSAGEFDDLTGVNVASG
jgi:hypothetical protein